MENFLHNVLLFFIGMCVGKALLVIFSSPPGRFRYLLKLKWYELKWLVSYPFWNNKTEEDRREWHWYWHVEVPDYWRNIWIVVMVKRLYWRIFPGDEKDDFPF